MEDATKATPTVDQNDVPDGQVGVTPPATPPADDESDAPTGRGKGAKAAAASKAKSIADEKIGKIVREWAYEFAPNAKTEWRKVDDDDAIEVKIETVHGVTIGKAKVGDWGSEASIGKPLDKIRKDQILA